MCGVRAIRLGAHNRNPVHPAGTPARLLSFFMNKDNMPNLSRRYLGTVQTDGGQFVWHVFETME